MAVERTDGPFEYYQDLHGGVTGDSIRQDAHDPGLKAATIGALAGELEGDARQVAGQLSGDITADVQANPETASDTAKKLAAKGNYAVGLILSFADMVDAFDTTVNTLNHRYKSELASAMRYAGQAAAATKDTSDDQQVTEAKMGPAVKASLQPEYAAAVNKLDNDADSVATKFKQGPTDANVRELIAAGLIPLAAAAFYPGLVLSAADKEAYWQNTVGKMSAQEQIDWINAHKDNLPPELAPAILPSVQEQYADQIADAIKKGGTVDASTVKLMAFFAKEEPYAHELFSKVSPRDFAAEIEDFNNDVFPDPNSHQGTDKDKLEVYKQFLNAAGGTLATYSNATGQYAPPGGAKALADKWFDAITDDDHKQDASALTLMIKSGGAYDHAEYNHEFLGNLTGRVFDWERSQDGAVWRPRDGDQMWDPNHPPELQGHSAGKGGSYLAYDGGMKATDGLANLLGGMAESPDAAKDFFMGRYEGADPGESMKDRMDYLVGGGDQRTWDGDDGSDDGDGLGLALEAATVGEDHRTTEGTEIASQLMQNIAEHGGKPDGKFTSEWHIGPEMTDSIGAIASGYTGDIYDQLADGAMHPGGVHLDLGDDPDETLKRVLGELGRPDDKTGLETLTSAMLLEGKGHYNDQLAAVQGPHNLDNLDGAGLEGVQQRNGKVMGMLLNEGLEMASDEDKSEEARNEMLSRGIDVVAGFIPGAGEGASELTKMTVDTLKDQAIEQLKQGIESQPDTDTYLDNQVLPLDQKIQANAVDSLIEHGYLDAQDSHKLGHFDGIGDAALTPDHKHLNPILFSHEDPKDMTVAQQQELAAAKEAYADYNDTPQSNQVLDLTAQAEFMKYFVDPTE